VDAGMKERQPALGYHDVHLREDPARDVVWRAIADYLKAWIQPSDHVLEVGAGYCHWINAVAARRRVAVDRWPEFPRYAAAAVETHVMDATHLATFGAGVFDVVLASNVLEHFTPEAVTDVIAGIEAVLKPRGRLIIVQPNFRYAYRTYFDDYTHRSIFTHVSMSALLRAHGFEIALCKPRFLPYSMRETRLPVHGWLIHAYLRSPIKPLAGQMLIVARKA
jgi:SAM-dependent methyltransferase